MQSENSLHQKQALRDIDAHTKLLHLLSSRVWLFPERQPRLKSMVYNLLMTQP